MLESCCRPLSCVLAARGDHLFRHEPDRYRKRVPALLVLLNPLRLVGLFILLRWLTWRAPRGLYHLVVPSSYDRWKVRSELRPAWAAHRRACRSCFPEHRAHVMATIEDALIVAGEVRQRLVRTPDAVEREAHR